MTGLQQKLVFCRSPRRFILFYKMTRKFSVCVNPFDNWTIKNTPKLQNINRLVGVGYGRALATKLFDYDMYKEFKQDVYEKEGIDKMCNLMVYEVMNNFQVDKKIPEKDEKWEKLPELVFKSNADADIDLKQYSEQKKDGTFDYDMNDAFKVNYFLAEELDKILEEFEKKTIETNRIKASYTKDLMAEQYNTKHGEKNENNNEDKFSRKDKYAMRHYSSHARSNQKSQSFAFSNSTRLFSTTTSLYPKESNIFKMFGSQDFKQSKADDSTANQIKQEPKSDPQNTESEKVDKQPIKPKPKTFTYAKESKFNISKMFGSQDFKQSKADDSTANQIKHITGPNQQTNKHNLLKSEKKKAAENPAEKASNSDEKYQKQEMKPNKERKHKTITIGTDSLGSKPNASSSGRIFRRLISLERSKTKLFKSLFELEERKVNVMKGLVDLEGQLGQFKISFDEDNRNEDSRIKINPNDSEKSRQEFISKTGSRAQTQESDMVGKAKKLEKMEKMENKENTENKENKENKEKRENQEKSVAMSRQNLLKVKKSKPKIGLNTGGTLKTESEKDSGIKINSNDSEKSGQEFISKTGSRAQTQAAIYKIFMKPLAGKIRKTKENQEKGVATSKGEPAKTEKAMKPQQTQKQEANTLERKKTKSKQAILSNDVRQEKNETSEEEEKLMNKKKNEDKFQSFFISKKPIQTPKQAKRKSGNTFRPGNLLKDLLMTVTKANNNQIKAPTHLREMMKKETKISLNTFLSRPDTPEEEIHRNKEKLALEQSFIEAKEGKIYHEFSLDTVGWDSTGNSQKNDTIQHITHPKTPKIADSIDLKLKFGKRKSFIKPATATKTTSEESSVEEDNLIDHN